MQMLAHTLAAVLAHGLEQQKRRREFRADLRVIETDYAAAQMQPPAACGHGSQ